MDETYRKAGKMDPECFSLMLDLSQTNLKELICDYLLEGTQKKDIIAEQYKLNVYRTHLIFIHFRHLTLCWHVAAQVKGRSSSLTSTPHAAIRCLARS